MTEAAEERLYGDYRATTPLGRGGVGAVYVAEHRSTGARVALKVLLPGLSKSREIVSRFFHEARLAASIADPGIADVIEFGYGGDGRAYIAMELLRGESLAARLSRAPRPPLAFLVYVGTEIARVMEAAHARQIVHRDLKPDNVFLARDPALPFGVRVKVLDFGMAKLGGEGAPHTIITEQGALLGTPLYMAPEQCRGAADVDLRADVYALGCVLYELACGRPPFVEGGIGMVLGAHVYAPVPPPRALAPDVPPALEALLLRALAKDREARFPSMRALARELAELAEPQGHHETSTRAPR